jgi:enterobactin synthetase component D
MDIFCESPPLFQSFVVHVSARNDRSAARDLASNAESLPAHVRNAADKRRVDFLLGRHCARHAVTHLLGDLPDDIGVGAHNAPVWPPGLVGSITHTDGFVSAAVTRSSFARAIGIDSERILTSQTTAEISSLVAAFDERPAPGSSIPAELHYTILFSAKESVFKCLFPLVGRMFFFEEAAVRLSTEEATFRATILTDLGPTVPAGFAMVGRYVVSPPFVHTGVLVPNRMNDVLS